MHSEFDKLDRALLALLSLCARTPHAILAQALGVAPNTVSSRIERLEKSGVIFRYAAVFDLRPLGFTRHHVMLRFSTKERSLEQQCRALSALPSAVWVSSYIGAFDAQVIVDSHDKLPLQEILAQIFAVCGSHLLDYAVFSDIDDLEFTNILPGLGEAPRAAYKDDGSFSHKLAQRSFPAPQQFAPYEVNALEFRLLQLLAKSPLASLTALAAQLGCDRQTVSRRINQLIDENILLSFGVTIDHQRLGLTGYHLLFRLQPGIGFPLLKRTFAGLEGLFYAGSAHGAYDLSVYLYAQNPQKLGASIERIRSNLGPHIRRTELMVFDHVYHWLQFTPSATAVLQKASQQRAASARSAARR